MVIRGGNCCDMIKEHKMETTIQGSGLKVQGLGFGQLDVNN